MKMKRKNKKKTVGIMTQYRGVMPPPSRVKESKKAYNRQESKRVAW
jgi:hypothetical protein